MPRKKPISSDVNAETPPPTESTTEQPKAATSRVRAAKAVPIQAAEAPKAPTRRRAVTAAAEPPAPPKAKPNRAKKTGPEPVIAAPAPAPKSRRLFGRAVVEPSLVAAAAPEIAVPSAIEPAKRSTRSSKRPAKSATTHVPRPTSHDNAFAGVADDLPIPSFRPRSTAPPKAEPEEENGDDFATDAVAEEADLAPRRSRRRRRKDLQGKEITAAGPISSEPVDLSTEVTEALNPVFRRRDGQEPKAAPARGPRTPRAKKVTPEPERAPEPPKRLPPPPKPLIVTPDDAPQVVLRDGVPTLVREGRVYPPIWFFGSSPDERRARTVLEELGMAADAGVHIHSHLIEFEVDRGVVAENAKVAAFLLAQTLRVDPEAQVLFRVVFVAPRGWQSEFPNAIYTTKEGHTAEPSVCDDQFWNVARDCLAEFVRSLRLLDQRDSILGVHLERGEWFFSAADGFDESTAAKLQFREWARERYFDDEVALRANWFDANVRFDTIDVPRIGRSDGQGEKFVRSSRKQRRFVDYHLFLADATVHRLGVLAYAIKEASEGYFLVGCSYGYTFEWSHPASGHLALGKLLRTPEIDFIAGPPSYKNREPGSSAPFPGPIDSFALNGKLYISEEDFKTSLSTGSEPDDFNPIIKTPQALDSVHWRGAGAALAHASGVSWMDLWGNGWLKTHSVWDRAAKIQRSLILHMAAPLDDPEVVVFIDERALAYLVDEKAFELLVQNARESVLRAGVSAGFYLLSDLAHRERFPEAKAYIFLNAWDIRPDLRAAIKTRLQRDNKVLFWLYSAGLFDAGRESLERAREVTGIALKPQPFHSRSGSTILNRRNPLCEAFPTNTIAGTQQLEPSYFAIPEEAHVLGEYSQTGLPSFVVRDFKPDGDGGQAWTSVFLGEPVVNPALIRALAQMAGAHVFNFSEDVIHVRPPFLTIHCSGPGQRTITLPNKWTAFNLLSNQWVAMESTNVRFTAQDGSTHVFLVGTHEEIEHLLLTKPDDLLRMDELPPRPDNTIRQDSFAFDVPIMKLDEWIEGGEPDEIADEWFLRPTAVSDMEETSEASSSDIGRRRRRRRGRGGGDRGGSEEVSSARYEPSGAPEDVSMNVMFRKRE